MTREEFDDMRADILGEINDAGERERVRAVTYEQAEQNRRDGIPVFGWPPAIPQADRDELMDMLAREHGHRPKVRH